MVEGLEAVIKMAVRSMEPPRHCPRCSNGVCELPGSEMDRSHSVVLQDLHVRYLVGCDAELADLGMR